MFVEIRFRWAALSSEKKNPKIVFYFFLWPCVAVCVSACAYAYELVNVFVIFQKESDKNLKEN